MADVPGFTIYPGDLKLLAIATPHQSRQNIGSEVPIFHRDSFPPGEAKRRTAAGYSQIITPNSLLHYLLYNEGASQYGTHKLPFRRRLHLSRVAAYESPAPTAWAPS